MSIWNLIFVNPTINALIVLNSVVFSNFGMAIILFTIVMRLVTMPLTLRQLRSSRALSLLQPQIQEIQKKYKDPRRRQEETMKLYRQAGVNPLGCLLPMIVQFPIWIALYQALRIIVGGTPESMLDLSQRLYPWSYIERAVPLQNHFLWLDLGQPDRTMILAIVVGVSTYVQQRLMTPPTTDPRTQSTNQMMTWMMPLMFAWFTLTVPSGLAVYWAVSNLTAVILNYFVYRPQGVTWRSILMPVPAPASQRGGRSARDGARKADRQQPSPKEPAELADQTPALSRREGAARPAEPVGSKQEKRSRHARARSKRKNRR